MLGSAARSEMALSVRGKELEVDATSKRAEKARHLVCRINAFHKECFCAEHRFEYGSMAQGLMVGSYARDQASVGVVGTSTTSFHSQAGCVAQLLFAGVRGGSLPPGNFELRRDGSSPPTRRVSTQNVADDSSVMKLIRTDPRLRQSCVV